MQKTAKETGMFYNLSLENTLKLKGEKCKEGKLLKQRVMVATNMSGALQKTLLLSGKCHSKRCCCFGDNCTANF